MPRSGDSVSHKTIKMGTFTQEVEFYLHWNHTSDSDYRELTITTYKNLDTGESLTAEEWNQDESPNTGIDKEAKISNIGEDGITSLLNIENTANSSDDTDNLYFKTLLLNCDLNSILYELADGADIVTEDIFQYAMTNAHYVYLGKALTSSDQDKNLFYGKLVSSVTAKSKSNTNINDSMSLYVVYTLFRGTKNSNEQSNYNNHDLEEYIMIRVNGVHPINIFLAKNKKNTDISCQDLSTEIENLDVCINQDIVKYIITNTDYLNLVDLMSTDYVYLRDKEGQDISNKQTNNYIGSYHNLLYLMSRVKFNSITGTNSMDDCQNYVDKLIKDVTDPDTP